MTKIIREMQVMMRNVPLYSMEGAKAALQNKMEEEIWQSKSEKRSVPLQN
ncbi:MAG: hypothetical protein ACI4MK_08580 [Aristaeellaceae bacterium]